MGETAKISSIDALKSFRASLIIFRDVCRQGLAGAESEMLRAIKWLRNDQVGYWRAEQIKRAEKLRQAKSDLAQKKLYKTPVGGRYSYIDEEKALAKAKARMEEADEKYENCRRWAKKLEDERALFKGQLQRLSYVVDLGIPKAVAYLDHLLDTLDAYLHAQMPKSAMREFESVARSLVGEGEPESEAPAEVSRSLGVESFEVLRARTPSEELRATAEAAEVFPERPEGCRIDEASRASLAALEIDREPHEENATLVIARGAAAADRIYLERLLPVAESDSGWFVGHADDTRTNIVETLLCRRVLARWPDWQEILLLPAGSLVVVDGGRVEIVLDAEGKVVWSAEDADADEEEAE